MSPSGLPARTRQLEFERWNILDEPIARPPVSFRESWRVIPLPRERGLVVSLLCHWASLRSESRLPRFNDLDPEAIPVSWRGCLLARREEKVQWTFDYRGDFFEEALGEAETLRTQGEPDLLGQISDWFDVVSQAMRPITLGGAFVRDDGTRGRFRCLFLPFGSVEGGVTHILAAATARNLLSLEPRHLPLEAYAYIDGYWVYQPAQP